MEPVAAKRMRSGNWVAEDKHLLIELVRERIEVIEDKNSDTNTNQRKLAAWTDLMLIFNSKCKGEIRNIPQLKSQWNRTKRAQKKKLYGDRNGSSMEGKDDSWSAHEFMTTAHRFSDDDAETDEEKLNNQEGAVYLNPVANCIPCIAPSDMPVPSRPKKKKIIKSTVNYAQKIAEVEMQCRKELHKVQMENEKKKSANMELEQILLRKKLEYYSAKVNSLNE